MAGGDFDYSQLRRLELDLQAATPKAVKMAQAAVKKTGLDVVATVQGLAPVDTGNLKNSIDVDFDDDGLGFEAGPTANYGGYVEWGTSRMAPQPYLGPAFGKAVGPLTRAVEQLGERALE